MDHIDKAFQESLIEGVVWRKFREVCPIGYKGPTEFTVLEHETAGIMKARVELKDDVLKFEVTWGDHSYSFER
jgi:hypothetical protein